jgi:DNA-binding CsgD family transcriptional regulator
MQGATLSHGPDDMLVHRLSRREHECLLWAARGKTYAEIVMITGVSNGTVKTHLDSSRYKLNCVSLAQATALAVALGIFTLDDLKGRELAMQKHEAF